MERDIINQSAIAARGPSFCGADNQEVGQYELCRHQSMGIIIRAVVAGATAGAAVVGVCVCRVRGRLYCCGGPRMLSLVRWSGGARDAACCFNMMHRLSRRL